MLPRLPLQPPRLLTTPSLQREQLEQGLQHGSQSLQGQHLEADELYASTRSLQPQGLSSLSKMSLLTLHAASAQGTRPPFQILLSSLLSTLIQSCLHAPKRNA